MHWILSLLRSPSSYRDDPWGYVRNQVGHAYIVGGGLALIGFPIWLILIGYAAWEITQYLRYDAELWDCFEDCAHVMLIAYAAAHMLFGLVFAHVLFLASGYFWRKGQVNAG